MGLGTHPESAIPRQSLFSTVANKLRDQIIRGEIAQGTQLRIEELFFIRSLLEPEVLKRSIPEPKLGSITSLVLWINSAL
jgi:DNA-binding GntR family transcriptional regulator